MALCVRIHAARNRCESLVVAALSQCRGLQHCFAALCAGDRRWLTAAHPVGGRTLAGWHESGEVAVPEGIHLVFLPPYSPELQPCERLWPLTNEAIANRRFATLDELRRGCKPSGVSFLLSDPLHLRRHTLFDFRPLSDS